MTRPPTSAFASANCANWRWRDCKEIGSQAAHLHFTAQVQCSAVLHIIIVWYSAAQHAGIRREILYRRTGFKCVQKCLLLRENKLIAFPIIAIASVKMSSSIVKLY